MKESRRVYSGSEVFDDIWEALDFAPAEAAKLRAGSELQIEILRIFKAEGWSVEEQAEHAGIPVAEVEALHSSQLEGFSIEDLMRIAGALGRKFHIEFEAA